LRARDDPVHDRRLADDVGDLHARVQRGHRVLKDHLHLERRRACVRAGEGRARAAAKLHRAGAGRKNPGDDAAERRLPAAGFPDEAHDLALVDREAHVVDRLYRGFAQIRAEQVGGAAGEIERRDEALAHMLERDDRLAHAAGSSA
jgi:hypothetical protein